MIETRSILDDEREWFRYVERPSSVNVKRFQKRLDRIAGKNASGLSILRLVWGYDSHATEWRCGQTRMKYRFHVVDLPNGDKLDLAVPRWFIEELMEPAQYMQEWERARYTVEGIDLIDDLGPPPVGGWYVHARTISDHGDGSCCRKAWFQDDARRRCWGRYMDPSDRDLEQAEFAVRERSKLKLLNRPDEPMHPDIMEDCRKANFERKKKWEDDLHYHVKMCIDEFVRIYGDNFTSDSPKRHHHGKYHILGNHDRIIPNSGNVLGNFGLSKLPEGVKCGEG